MRHSSDMDAASWKDVNMPEMFDYIFFVIVLVPSAALVWDWLRDR